MPAIQPWEVTLCSQEMQEYNIYPRGQKKLQRWGNLQFLSDTKRSHAFCSLCFTSYRVFLTYLRFLFSYTNSPFNFPLSSPNCYQLFLLLRLSFIIFVFASLVTLFLSKLHLFFQSFLSLRTFHIANTPFSTGKNPAVLVSTATHTLSICRPWSVVEMLATASYSSLACGWPDASLFYMIFFSHGWNSVWFFLTRHCGV